MNEKKKKTEGRRFPGSGNPFRVPEGYFDALPERALEQIRKAPSGKPEEKGGGRTVDLTERLRRLGRLRIAAAAAIVVLALASIPMVQWITRSETMERDSELAWLEAAGVFRSEYDLALSLEQESTDPEEAYLDEVEAYLAAHDVEMDLTDVEMDLIFEQK